MASKKNRSTGNNRPWHLQLADAFSEINRLRPAAENTAAVYVSFKNGEEMWNGKRSPPAYFVRYVCRQDREETGKPYDHYVNPPPQKASNVYHAQRLMEKFVAEASPHMKQIEGYMAYVDPRHVEKAKILPGNETRVHFMLDNKESAVHVTLDTAQAAQEFCRKVNAQIFGIGTWQEKPEANQKEAVPSAPQTEQRTRPALYLVPSPDAPA